MRVLFALAALVLLGTFAPPSLQRFDPPPAVTILNAEPVPLDETKPGERRLGSLHYLGGWSLTSNDFRFGGISAMHVEGSRVLGFSDAGFLLSFRVPNGPRQRAAVASLPEGPGDPDEKSDRDVEAVAFDGPHAWIAFERKNQIWRYRSDGWSRSASARPAAMRDWSSNTGCEAMVRLKDGRFLVFAEGKGGESDALFFGGDPAEAGAPATKIKYRPPSGYRLTDAALLPDGRILFLNRRIRLLEGFTAKLTVAEPPYVRQGLVEGREVAAFAGSTVRDNFEALSVTREAGRTIVWIASDDNFNPLQRTLLLKFAFAG